ncbi:MAG: DNA-binding FrmR family transcriptional regulator [Bacteriovoracaceae bacterium]|jgi:DNA-binding FrmR family transcriptional regulator
MENTPEKNNKYNATHKALLNRTSRINGQVSGIASMIEQEKYCIDILIQIKAARSALKSLELEIMEGHMKCCLKGAMKSGSEVEINEKIKEIVELVRKTSK